jgi:hypothetical protein
MLTPQREVAGPYEKGKQSSNQPSGQNIPGPASALRALTGPRGYSLKNPLARTPLGWASPARCRGSSVPSAGVRPPFGGFIGETTQNKTKTGGAVERTALEYLGVPPYPRYRG